MNAQQYEIVFSGAIREGHEAAAVYDAFAALLGAPATQIKGLFSGVPRVIRRTTSLREARAFVHHLAQLGAVAIIRKAGEGETLMLQAGEATGGGTGDATQATPPAYLPFRGKWLYKPMLYAAALVAGGLTLVYALLLPLLLAAWLYHLLFGDWVAALVPFAPLATAVHGILVVVGFLLLLILTKPLLALKLDLERGILLTAKQQPDLFAFIADLCERLDAPPPSEVRIDNYGTMSVGYLRGPRGFIRNEWVLTLGLPLIAALNTRLLAAALAGQIAHFARGNAPRAGNAVLLLDRWLHRAVHEPDAVDRRLESLRQSHHRIIARAAAGATVLSHLSRLLTRLALTVYRAPARRLIQRRIADADRTACRMAGTRGLATVLQHSRLLALAEANTLPDLKQVWERKGTLPDNIAMAITRRAQHYPFETAKRLRRLQQKQQADTRDILPSDLQRVGLLRNDEQPGEYRCPSPAGVLFHNFGKLSHRMTVRFYRHRLKLTITANKLVRTVAKDSDEDRCQRRLDAAFQKIYADFLPLRLGALLGEEAPALEEITVRWREAVEEIRQGQARQRLAYARWKEADDRLIEATYREAAHRTASLSPLHRLRQRKEQPTDVHQACRDREQAHEQATAALATQIRPFIQRLAAALSLLLTQEAASRMARCDALRQEMQRLVEGLGRLERIQPDLHSIRLHGIVLEALMNEDNERNPKLQDRVGELADDIRRLLTGIGVALKGAMDPLVPGARHTLMARALDGAMRDDGTPPAVYDRGADAVQRLTLVRRLALGRLLVLAEAAERAFGLVPTR